MGRNVYKENIGWKSNKNVLLYVENANWNEIHMGYDWEYTSFTLLKDGLLCIQVFYGNDIYKNTSEVEKTDFIYMKKLMRSILNNPPKERVDACDGDAWSFVFYNEKGRRIYKRDMDYTYGIEKFEKLQNKLESYIPDRMRIQALLGSRSP